MSDTRRTAYNAEVAIWTYRCMEAWRDLLDTPIRKRTGEQLNTLRHAVYYMDRYREERAYVKCAIDDAD